MHLYYITFPEYPCPDRTWSSPPWGPLGLGLNIVSWYQKRGIYDMYYVTFHLVRIFGVGLNSSVNVILCRVGKRTSFSMYFDFLVSYVWVYLCYY
jgi:hypothetical protein